MDERTDRPDRDIVEVTLQRQRSDVVDTEDQALWVVIRNSSPALSFAKYARFYPNHPQAQREHVAHDASYLRLLSS